MLNSATHARALRPLAIASIVSLVAGCNQMANGPAAPGDVDTIPVAKLIDTLKTQFQEEQAKQAKSGSPPFFEFIAPVTVEFNTVVTKSGELGVPTLAAIPLNAKLDLSSQLSQKITMQLQPILLGNGVNETTLTRPPPGQAPSPPAPSPAPPKPIADSQVQEPNVVLRNAHLIIIGQTMYLVGIDASNQAEVWIKAEPFSKISAAPK